jgi:hypothetical protein
MLVEWFLMPLKVHLLLLLLVLLLVHVLGLDSLPEQQLCWCQAPAAAAAAAAAAVSLPFPSCPSAAWLQPCPAWLNLPLQKPLLLLPLPPSLPLHLFLPLHLHLQTLQVTLCHPRGHHPLLPSLSCCRPAAAAAPAGAAASVSAASWPPSVLLSPSSSSCWQQPYCWRALLLCWLLVPVTQLAEHLHHPGNPVPVPAAALIWPFCQQLCCLLL